MAEALFAVWESSIYIHSDRTDSWEALGAE